MSPEPERPPVIFVDTETLGLDSVVQPMWEVAAVMPGGSSRLWQLPVTEVEISLANPVAQELTGFEERYAMRPSPGGGRPWRLSEMDVLLEDFVDDFGEMARDKHWVGAVPSFDEERIRSLFRRYGRLPTWHYHLIDVETLMVAAVARDKDRGAVWAGNELFDPRALPWKSRDLSRAVGVDPDDYQPAHTALADARWARACWEAVMG